ncbi:MAG: MFS transporter [Chloroflexota bacterium]|nr:MFS transporter [Chloroflexota bacterium]
MPYKIKRPNIFYGWWIVLSAGIVQWYSSAVFWRGFPPFFDAILSTFGWSTAATGAAVSIQRSESGLISPFVGTIIKRFGPKRVMAFGIFLTGGSFIWMSRMQNLWEFYCAITILTLGMSFGTFIIFLAVVGNWFQKNRGKAISMLMSGAGLGGITIPLIVLGIEEFGWRNMIFSVGLGFWILGFPTSLVLRGDPEDYGQYPDGEKPKSTTSIDDKKEQKKTDFSVKEALKSGNFWKLALAAGISQSVFTSNLFHLTSFKEFGLTTTFAATIIGLSWWGDIAGRIIIGFITDRFDRKKLLIISFTLLTIGILGISIIGSQNEYNYLNKNLGIILFVVFFGLGFGSSVPLRLTLAADYFGRKNYGSMVGILNTVGAIFGTLSPLLIGLTKDFTGEYKYAYYILTLMMIFSIPLVFSLRKNN